MNHIFAVPEKSDYAITFPVVGGYHDPGLIELTVDWKRVPKLVLDPQQIPDSTLVKGLNTIEGRLTAYGPGAEALVDLNTWRTKVRVQQVAFDLAAELTKKWMAEEGSVIPWHRLFPPLLNFTRKFLAEYLECGGHSQPQDVALNPYFQSLRVEFPAACRERFTGVLTSYPAPWGGVVDSDSRRRDELARLRKRHRCGRAGTRRGVEVPHGGADHDDRISAARRAAR